MPNIMLCGFQAPERLRSDVVAVLDGLGLGSEAVTSIVPMRVESCDGKRTPSPYLRVCSTDADEVRRIVDALKKAGIGVDVEWLVLNGFIPASEMK